MCLGLLFSPDRLIFTVDEGFFLPRGKKLAGSQWRMQHLYLRVKEVRGPLQRKKRKMADILKEVNFLLESIFSVSGESSAPFSLGSSKLCNLILSKAIKKLLYL